MTVSSPTFDNNETIPQQYTCQGGGVHPQLIIKDVPKDTKSLALIVDDPDAPVGLFTHWVIWHIDPTTEVIEEDDIPTGAIEGINSAGVLGWVAPCPPEGTGIHHYRFMLFAFSKEDLENVDEGAKREEVEAAIAGSDIARAELVGLYSFPK